MAIEVERTRTDDLDGTPASETVTFTYEGRTYEVDLSEENARKYHDAMAPFVRAARRARHVEQQATYRDPDRVERNAEIRAWARAQGIKVRSTGRIPADVIARWEEAHAS